jgi:hypothetical protein
MDELLALPRLLSSASYNFHCSLKCPLWVLSDVATKPRHARLTPKTDMCGATKDVRYGPRADIRLLNHLVDAGEQCRLHRKAERLGCLDVEIRPPVLFRSFSPLAFAHI